MTDSEQLSKLFSKAVKLSAEEQYDEAIKLTQELLSKCPNWEHGSAHELLASCYEDIGNIIDAEKYYRQAIEFEPRNYHYLVNYASFLKDYGDPNESLKLFFQIIRNEGGRKEIMDHIKPSLMKLVQKLQISESELALRLKTEFEQ